MKKLLGTLLLTAFVSPSVLAGTIHVDIDATGSADGTSWSDAHTDLTAALATAVSGDEIWVAKGTYKPTSGTDRGISFLMKNGVALYGGFDGDEATRAERDSGPLTNATILSGEIGDSADRTDNTHHVVLGTRSGVNLDDSSILDGFTITAGYAADRTPDHTSWGGGFESRGSGAEIIRNCHFHDNDSIGRGGGASVFSGSPLFENCHFTDNRAQTSAGLNIWGSSAEPEIRSCTFKNNNGSAAGGGTMVIYGAPLFLDTLFEGNNGGFGGAIYAFNCNPVFQRCQIVGNTGVRGGAFNTQQPGTPHFIDCLITGNHATNHGGALFCNVRSTPKFTNVTISGNRSDTDGGAIYSDDLDTIASFENSILWNNMADGSTATENSSFLKADGGEINFASCIVHNSGGGDPMFLSPLDPSVAPAVGGDYQVSAGSSAVDAGDDSFNTVAIDLAGNPRTLNAIDIGAYEFQSLIALWATDFDGDGLSYGLEQAIGTDPASSDSGDPATPRMIAPGQLSFGVGASAPAGTVWTIRRSTDLGDFSDIIYGPSTTPPGSPFTDSNSAVSRAFYRLDVALAED